MLKGEYIECPKREPIFEELIAVNFVRFHGIYKMKYNNHKSLSFNPRIDPHSTGAVKNKNYEWAALCAYSSRIRTILSINSINKRCLSEENIMSLFHLIVQTQHIVFVVFKSKSRKRSSNAVHLCQYICWLSSWVYLRR